MSCPLQPPVILYQQDFIMKIKAILLCGFVVAGCFAAGIIICGRNRAHQLSPKTNQTRLASEQSWPIKRRSPQMTATDLFVSNSTPDMAQIQLDPVASTPQKSPQNRAAKEPLHDPIAREALAMVGFDPEAELYWFEAINDLSLPANERQDLIEDLNEEGLPDPKHPTPDDLPLILNRIALIEAVGPDAADKVNADAFEEAYKDLLNLAELAMGGGNPVK